MGGNPNQFKIDAFIFSGLDNSPNPFIDNSLFYALSLVQFLCQPRWPNNIAIKVFADNDFYSQSAQVSH